MKRHPKSENTAEYFEMPLHGVTAKNTVEFVRSRSSVHRKFLIALLREGERRGFSLIRRESSKFLKNFRTNNSRRNVITDAKKVVL